MKNPIRIAAIGGIVFLTLPFLFIVVAQFIPRNIFVSVSYLVLLSVFTILFYFGFYKIGKKYNNKLLSAIAIIFIILTLISSIATIHLSSRMGHLFDSFEEFGDSGNQYKELIEKYGGKENIPDEESNALLGPLTNALISIFSIILLLHLVFAVVYGIPTILLGIGLKKLEGEVKYAKTTGILLIVGGASLIFFIGYLILYSAYIFEIMLLFSEANKNKFKAT